MEGKSAGGGHDARLLMRVGGDFSQAGIVQARTFSVLALKSHLFSLPKIPYHEAGNGKDHRRSLSSPGANSRSYGQLSESETAARPAVVRAKAPNFRSFKRIVS